MSRRRELEHENAILRDALRYYANRGIWRKAGIHPKGMRKRFSPAPVIKDKGDKARNALAITAHARKQLPLSVPALLWRTLSGRRDGGA